MNIMDRSGIAAISDLNTVEFAELLEKLEPEQEHFLSYEEQFRSPGHRWAGFAMNAAWAVMFILVMPLLVDVGFLGLSSARAISYLCHTTWTSAFAFFLISRRLQNELYP